MADPAADLYCIRNPLRQSTLATRAQVARGFLPRMRGLMGRPSLPEGEALLLLPESSIHTFFMRFPLDVLYLSRDFEVLRATHEMAAWRVGPLYTKGCHAILELPPGTIAATQTQVGDRLALDPIG